MDTIACQVSEYTVTNDEAMLFYADCLFEAEHLCQRFGWALLQPAQLARQASILLAEKRSPSTRKAVIGAYCMALYNACGDAINTERRDQAYYELGFFLFSRLRTRYAALALDLHADAVQMTCERVHRNLAACREPIAFFAFVAQQLLDSIRMLQRQSQRPEFSLDAILTDALQYGGNEPADPGLLPEEQVFQHVDQESVRRLFEEAIRLHPESERRFRVLWMQKIDKRTTSQIAEHMQLTPNAVYTLAWHATNLLRTDPVLVQYARDLGLIA